jgi:phage baseplate assembly protein W
MSQTNIWNREFIGRGLTFPLQVDSQGRLALTNGENEIFQSIRVILETSPGERVMRPTFGCRVWELIFEPRDASTEALLKEYVREALAMWEPRIEVTGVDILEEGAPQEVVMVNIRYLIKNTHDERSIVYPFYIMDER